MSLIGRTDDWIKEFGLLLADHYAHLMIVPVDHTDSACWLYCTKAEGMWTARYDDYSHRLGVHVHRLAAFWHHCSHPEATIPSLKELEKKEASHLCNNKACVRPDHLKFERSTTNRSRNYCKISKTLPGGGQKIICEHYPNCLKRHTEAHNLIQEDFLRLSEETTPGSSVQDQIDHLLDEEFKWSTFVPDLVRAQVQRTGGRV